MEVNYTIGKDLGKKYWRVYVNKSNSTISIVVENFDMGFKTGEEFDKIADFKTSYGSDTYENYVSVITKNKNRIEEYKELVIERLYIILGKNLKAYERRIKQNEKIVKNYEKSLECDLFKSIKRNEVIDKIIE